MKESYELKKQGDYYVSEVPLGSGKNFAFRKWNWGEKNALTNQCSVVNPINGDVSFNNINFVEQFFLKTVFKYEEEKAIPFTVEEIKNLDGQLGERLYQITQKINLVSNVDTQNL